MRILGIPEPEGEGIAEEMLSVINSTLLPPLTVEEVDRVHPVGQKEWHNQGNVWCIDGNILIRDKCQLGVTNQEHP